MRSNRSFLEQYLVGKEICVTGLCVLSYAGEFWHFLKAFLLIIKENSLDVLVKKLAEKICSFSFLIFSSNSLLR